MGGRVHVLPRQVGLACVSVLTRVLLWTTRY
jgi:hypothetical protein